MLLSHLILLERTDLDENAKKGLESSEDIKSASQGLKRTEKDKSGISRERINQYDGVRPVMLFQVKGKNYFELYLDSHMRTVERCKNAQAHILTNVFDDSSLWASY